VSECLHCKDAPAPEGLVCAYCLGGGSCDAHGDRQECVGLVTPEQREAYAELTRGGHVLALVCGDCGALVAGCDVPDVPLDARPVPGYARCGNAAYKWVDVGTGVMPSGTFYFCEDHGELPHLLEFLGLIPEWGAYMPGAEGCVCDYPY